MRKKRCYFLVDEFVNTDPLKLTQVEMKNKRYLILFFSRSVFNWCQCLYKYAGRNLSQCVEKVKVYDIHRLLFPNGSWFRKFSWTHLRFIITRMSHVSFSFRKYHLHINMTEIPLVYMCRSVQRMHLIVEKLQSLDLTPSLSFSLWNISLWNQISLSSN